MNLDALVRRDLAAALARLGYRLAASVVGAARPPVWRLIAADLAARTSTRDQHLAAAARDAAESMATCDADAAARRLAGLCGLSVHDWSAQVEAEPVPGAAVPFSYEPGCVRVDAAGRWFLCNKRATGWSSFAHEYPSLDALRAAWAVDLGVPGVDDAGVYWTLRRPAAGAAEAAS